MPVSHDLLITWFLLTAPHLSSSQLEQYIPPLIGFIEYFITDDVTRTKLFSEVAHVLLVDNGASGGGEECVRPTSLLQTVLTHPLVATALHDDDRDDSSHSSMQQKGPNITTRERIVAALCRLVVKLLPLTIARFVQASRASPLLPASVEEIRQTAATAATAASSTVADATTDGAVFGNDTIDLFPTPNEGVRGTNNDTTGDTNSPNPPLLAGLGPYLEMTGVSLKTIEVAKMFGHLDSLDKGKTSVNLVAEDKDGNRRPTEVICTRKQ